MAVVLVFRGFVHVMNEAEVLKKRVRRCRQPERHEREGDDYFQRSHPGIELLSKRCGKRIKAWGPGKGYGFRPAVSVDSLEPGWRTAWTAHASAR